VRIAPAVARLLEELDGATPLADLEAARPGTTTALSRLAEAGLVTAT